MKEHSQDTDALFDRAIALRDGGDFEGAADALQSFLAMTPDSVAALVVLGDCALELGRFQAARDAFRRATELAPTHEHVSLSLFHALWDLAESGEEWARAEALAEAKRFLTVSDSDAYREIIQELHDRTFAKPDP